MLEAKKHEYEEIKRKFVSDIGTLKFSKNEVGDRIHRTEQEKNILENTTQDEHNKVLDPLTYKNIEKNVKELYGIAFAEKAESKMNNSSVLPLLNELEKVIDTYLFDFKEAESATKDIVQNEATIIKKTLRAENRDKARAEESKLNKEKQNKKQQEKDSKVVVKVGKPTMNRSKKPAVKKQEVKKKILSEEELDLRKYLEV